MRFFNVQSTDEIDNILYKFSNYYAQEKHSIFTSWFTPYYNSRIGIHTYINDNWVWGYYETGKRGTQNMLLSSKSWFYINLKTKNNKTFAKGMVIEDIFLLPALFSTTLIQTIRFLCFGNNDCLSIAFITLIFALFFLKPTYETNKKLYDTVISVLFGEDR